MSLSPDDLNSMASAVYGSRWQSVLSRDSGVNLRTVQRWALAGIGNPATADGIRRFLEEKRRARVPAPSAILLEADRDDACRDALDPALGALVAAAVEAGWHPAEVAAAILGFAVDTMRDGAGAPATMATLRDVIASIQSSANAI